MMAEEHNGTIVFFNFCIKKCKKLPAKTLLLLSIANGIEEIFFTSIKTHLIDVILTMSPWGSVLSITFSAMSS